MNWIHRRAAVFVIWLMATGSIAGTLDELLGRLETQGDHSPEAIAAVRAIFSRSPWLGQGNPKVTHHPMTRAECLERHSAVEPPPGAGRCGASYMAPLYDPATESPDEARACIDQFEFPNLPCEYPVVWIRANEAAGVCAALGKRLCDAHEWEGACAGALLPPDYRFDLSAESTSAGAKVNLRRTAHNRIHDNQPRWAYGAQFDASKCAMDSRKSPDCTGGDWARCGSNTYPTGAFPQCVSPLGVYDLHGNAAEHMNLPLAADQMVSRGSTTLGVTEMKGSWFIWAQYRAHPDSCRWRAPHWHGSRVLDPRSHHNYHLGFRCCKDIGEDRGENRGERRDADPPQPGRVSSAATLLH